MITNPISAEQIVDVNVDLKCLPSTTCKTLPVVLQSIIDKVCEDSSGGSDPGSNLDLDFKCLLQVATQKALNQSLIDEICILKNAVVPEQPCTFNNCASDNWDCSNRDTCFEVTNPCNPTEVTICDTVQALLKRSVAYGDVIIDLCNRITTLESRLNTIQTQLTVIQTTCCNV